MRCEPKIETSSGLHCSRRAFQGLLKLQLVRELLCLHVWTDSTNVQDKTAKHNIKRGL
jgi:hypothetical protein